MAVWGVAIAMLNDGWWAEICGPDSYLAELEGFFGQEDVIALCMTSHEGSRMLLMRDDLFVRLDDLELRHKHAKKCLQLLKNIAVFDWSTDEVFIGGIVLVQGGRLIRKDVFVEVSPLRLSLKLGRVDLRVRDQDGSEWVSRGNAPEAAVLRAAAVSAEVEQAVLYLTPECDWFELYKAYELLKSIGRDGGPSRNELDLFSRTANTMYRHPEGRNAPPPVPMSLDQARKVIRQMLIAAAHHQLNGVDAGNASK